VVGVASVFAGRASAGPWSIEPSIGASADYDTNPGLHVTDVQSEEHVAALVDLPLRYHGDNFEWMLRPNGRLSDSRGYDSLAANYAHLDTSAQYTSDLWSASFIGSLQRDSSLYFVGALANGIGVRRDGAQAQFDFTRNLSARAQVALDGSWSETRYDQPPTLLSVLSNYRYSSAGPTAAYAIDERTTFKLLASAGHYQSLDELTDSKSYSAQLELVRQLTEIWTVTAAAGYSRAINSERIFFGPFYLGTIKANENGGVYSVNLTRAGERFTVNTTVSRALQPTGLAFLARLDTAGASLTFTQSEYWDYSLTGTWQRAVNPVLTGQSIHIRFLNAQAAANWHWTPQWICTVSGGRIGQEYSPPRTSASSWGVTISVTRHFLRREL
jgi:hypothetical protein